MMKRVISDEVEELYHLAEKLTGHSHQGASRREIVLTNVCNRVEDLNFSSLSEYLECVRNDSKEREQFLSLVTIHTTEWFREQPHFDMISEYFKRVAKQARYSKVIRALSAACSTGQEPYSLALVLEEARLKGQIYDYHIDGFDIDALSVSVGRQGVFPACELSKIPVRFHNFLSQDKARETFSFSSSIQSRVHFYSENLLNMDSVGAFFDLIICRNVLIYFSLEMTIRIVDRFKDRIHPGGLLVLGHSEILDLRERGFDNLGHSVFERTV